METTFKARIISGPSKLMTKSNGGAYVLHTAEVLDGKLKGLKVSATRTLINAQKEEKSAVDMGQEVTLYMTVEQDERGAKPFFEISTGAMADSDESILAAIGYNAATQQV